MPPVPSELHVDRWLTDLSVAFRQSTRDFVSDKVFPTVSVLKQSDLYIIYNRGDFWREGQVHERPLGGRLDVADWGKTQDSYRCVERGLAHKVDDRQYANTDAPMDLDRQAMELLTSQMMVDGEKRFLDEFFKPGIWTTDLTGVASADFTTIAAPSTGTPLITIDVQKEAMKRLTALEPNVLILGAVAYRHCRNHNDVKELYKYVQRGIIEEELLALAFGVDRLVVPRGVSNAAKEGQADDLDFILDNSAAGGTSSDALLLYAAPRPGINTPSAGYTFAWTGLIPGSTNPMGGVIMRGRDEFAHSEHFEIRNADDMKIVSADLGVYLDAFSS